ncbi:MAG: aldose 1-epimerase family protein [Clostridia bacterium]|nr:aldose 1-epimerase family protein [Clostridia bacterium]
MSLKIEVENKGAELMSIKFNNKEMLHNGKEYWDRRAPILFPMVGRLRDDKTIINNKEYSIPQHGFAKDMKFELIQETENTKIYFTRSNLETLKMYPFEFELYVTYEIQGDTLSVKYKVINKDKKDMLFGIGGHPGFKIDSKQEEYYFELEKIENEIEFMEVAGKYISNTPSKNLLIDGKIIDIKEDSFINDAIMIKNFKSKTITLKQNNNKKILEFDISEFPVLGIWSIPNAPFICIEPWFNTADKVIETGYFKDKEGIKVLKPNEQFNCKFSVRFF